MALAGASPSRRDREEFLRMNAEKVAAFYECWNGMLLAAYRANLQLFAAAWPANWAGPRASLRRTQRTALDILASGIAPVHRRAVANAKRLAKR
jgi:hypothetical protein